MKLKLQKMNTYKRKTLGGSQKDWMMKKNSAIRVIKILLCKIMEQLEIRRLLDEHNGKNAPELLIDTIEKLTTEKKNLGIKYDEYDINCIVILLKQMPGFQRFIKYNMIDDSCLRLAVANIKLARYTADEYIFREGSRTKEFFGIIKGTISIRVRKKSYEEALNQMFKQKQALKAFNLSIEEQERKERERELQNNERNLSPIRRSVFHSFQEKFNDKLLLPDTVNNSPESSPRKAPIEKRSSIMNINNLKSYDGESMIFKKTTNTKQTLATKRLWLSEAEKKYLDIHHETEILKFTGGLCFGEWGLLYNIPRTASAMSIDDSILFSIDKEDFDKALSKSLLKAETERKKFILQKVPAFTQIPLVKFDEFYRKVIAIFTKNKDIVYSDRTTPNAFYLLYQGTCRLQKNYLNNIKSDPSLLDMKLFTVLNLEKGDLTGLEAINGSKNYEYNLVTSSTDAILFKIDLNLIASEFRKIITKELIEIHNKKSEIITSIVKRYNFIKQKMKLKYTNLCEDIQKNTVVCYEKLSKEAQAVQEKQNMKFMKFLQREKYIENKTKHLLPMRVSSPIPTKKDGANTSTNVTYDMSTSFLKSARVTMTINNKLEYKPLIKNKDFINAQAQKNDNLSHDFSNMQTPFKFNHSRVGSNISNTSNIINSNYSSTYIDSESKMSNPRLSQTRPSSRYGHKRKIFEEELSKKVEERDIENRRGSMIYAPISCPEPEEKEIIRNKKLRMNLKDWKKTSFDKTKRPFNSGSFNLPLFVFKNGNVK